MTIMRDIVNEILTEVRFASGQDVQIHLQPGIMQSVSRLYRKLHLKHVWRDYVYYKEFTLDDNGIPDNFPLDEISKFSNIVGVFLEGHKQPLPVAPAGHAIKPSNRPVVIPTFDDPFFAIASHRGSNGGVWYKKYQEIDFQMENDVPFDKDILITGVAYDLAMKSGVNADLTKALYGEHLDLVRTHRLQELQDLYQTNLNQSDYPNEWFER